MGDGFLCSVGFPLSLLKEAFPGNPTVFSLAQKFVEIFEESGRMYLMESGSSVQYRNCQRMGGGILYFVWNQELRAVGQGIVLATRYENL